MPASGLQCIVDDSLTTDDGYPDMVRILFLILGLALSACLHAAGGGGDAPPDPYLELKPDFVVNIGDPSNQERAYVKAEITLRFHDPKVREKAEDHEPWLRHELVMLLSGQPVERMRSPDGQAELREEARRVLNERLSSEMPKVAEAASEESEKKENSESEKETESAKHGMIREVLFPNFIVQAR